MASLKGICASNLWKASALGAQWARVSYSDILYDPRVTVNLPWAIDLSHKYAPLTNDRIEKMVEFHNYSGYVLLGNEDYWWARPDEWWNLNKPQAYQWLAVDRNVKFILPCGSVNETLMYPFWVDNSWGRNLWKAVKGDAARKNFAGFHWHLYPSEYSITEAMRNMRNYMEESFPNKENWITEVGRPVVPGTYAGNNYTPAHVAPLADRFGVDRWCWYIQEGDSAYYNLQDQNGLTDYGTEFVGV